MGKILYLYCLKFKTYCGNVKEKIAFPDCGMDCKKCKFVFEKLER